jgi:hypothetical protein
MCRLLLAALIAMIAAGMASAETVRVFAAGSLRVALTDVVRTFQAKSTGLQVETEFAASGLLRARIEKGEAAHIFASADMGHPARLFDGGYAKTNVAISLATSWCALAREGLKVTPASLLEAMLDPGVRVGISTPRADPSGDYAFALFGKAESHKVGARAALEAKALQLTGGPASEKAPRPRTSTAGSWRVARPTCPHLLHQCHPGAQRGGEPADRADPAGAECGGGLWDDRAEGCAGAGYPSGPFHPGRRRANDPRETRFWARQRRAEMRGVSCVRLSLSCSC